jgi:hypothetical protein
MCKPVCVAPESAAPASTLAPNCDEKQSKPSRRVQWVDEHDEAKELTEAMNFHKDDEAWRCNNKSNSPVLSPLRQSAVPSRAFSLNAVLPACSAQMGESLSRKAVQLESVLVHGTSLLLTIRCLNIAFNKRITVNYTSDHWTSVSYVQAQYTPTTNNSCSDRFQAIIECSGVEPYRIEFAISYEVEGYTYWDNNEGSNYSVTIEEQSPKLEQSESAAFKPILRFKALKRACASSSA